MLERLVSHASKQKLFTDRWQILPRLRGSLRDWCNAAAGCVGGHRLLHRPRVLKHSFSKPDMRSLKKPAGIALLLIDFINLLPGNPPSLGPRAVRAARSTALLKQRAKAARIPVIYANDHFGDWRSDFPSLVKKCGSASRHSRELAEILCPGKDDYSVLKPMHSAFYGTPLEFLLDELDVRRLILTGLEADICLLFTGQDAHMRRFALWIPADCVASRSERRLKSALEFMRQNLKATTQPSTTVTRLRSAFPG